MKNKKTVVGGIIVSGLLLVFVLNWLFGWTAKPADRVGNEKTASPTPRIVTSSLPAEDEPEIILDINADRSGAILVIDQIASKFTQLEYELIYMAYSDDQEVERGVAGGPIDIPDNGKVTESLLFGTESCTTGVCKRHIDKNVSSGTLAVRFIDKNDKAWSIEKAFTIEKISGTWEAVWAL